MLPLAAMPLLQMTGACDPGAVVGSVIGSINLAVFNLFVGSIRQALIQDLPSADFLQFLLGNSPPIFTG
jgi:hypothetical protein